MTFRVPWVISDVTEVPLEVARMLAYAATGGSQGVVGPGDLQVRSLSTPGSSVRIAPGTFIALNNFPSNDNQSYIGWNDGEITKAVTATGPATRSDLVYARIWDGGQTNGGTSGIASVEIAQGVNPSTTTLEEVNANIAGVALARIDMPANTSTVDQAYITDLRKLVNPRRREIVRIHNMPDSSSVQNLTSASYVTWPSQATWSVEIPDWAVRAQLVVNIAGYQIYEGATTTGASLWGKLRAGIGTLYTAATDYNYSVPAGLGKVDAGSTVIAGDLYIPAADRGTTKNMLIQGLRTSATPSSACIRTNWGTVVVMQVIFYEDPDSQFWAQ